MTNCKCAIEGHDTKKATGKGRENIAKRRKHREEENRTGRNGKDKD